MPRVLLLDNFDSFTYNLVDYLLQHRAEVDVIQNTAAPERIDLSRYDGLLLSPGPETPRKAGNLMAVLAKSIGKLPVLGVCLGHQAIGEHFGATLAPAHKPMHGKVSAIEHNHSPLFANLPNPLNVVRYHSLVLTQVPDCLQVTATTVSQPEVMGVRHRSLPVEGVQFHPEAILTQSGLAMLKNWLSFIQQERNLPLV